MNHQETKNYGMETIFDPEKVPNHVDMSLVGDLGICEETCFVQPCE